MKKSLLLLILLSSATILTAQEKRINGYYSATFDDSFETYNSNTDYYSGKIKGGVQWGAGLEFKVKENYGVELMYLRQDTDAEVNSYYGFSSNYRKLDISVNYYLLGFNRYFKEGKVEPYGSLLVGASYFSNKTPVTGDPSSVTKFALGFRLGTNIWVSERVGIKLQAQFLSSIQGFGGGFYFGTGGSGAGVSTYSSVTQLNLGGGLVFKIGE